MKALPWIVFAVLAALWSGVFALVLHLSEWLAAAIDAGQLGDAAATAAQAPLPAWLGAWVDPAWLQAMQASLLATLQWLQSVLPSASGVLAWIAPLAWVAWGLGMLALLLATAVLHGLMGWVRRAGATPAERAILDPSGPPRHNPRLSGGR